MVSEDLGVCGLWSRAGSRGRARAAGVGTRPAEVNKHGDGREAGGTGTLQGAAQRE